MNNIDLNNKLDRLKYIKISEFIIDELINEISLNKKIIFNSKHINKNQIGILFRWQIYVSINLFIDKLLLFIKHKKK